MSDGYFRIAIFVGVLLLFAGLELLAPRRAAALGRAQRWPAAAVLMVFGVALSRLVMPLGLAGIAIWANGRGLGLLNMVELPATAAFIIAIIAMDFAIWVQHVLLHLWHPLWRLHRVHHTDPHLDVMTALRFHPAELFLSLGWKAAAVILFGVPAAAAFWYEVALNAMAQFNHANIRLPLPVDHVLRLFVVTPDMHRVHHSVHIDEHNRNFGNGLSLWDRLFRLYVPQPRDGHADMQIGQVETQDAEFQTPLSALAEPLRQVR